MRSPFHNLAFHIFGYTAAFLLGGILVYFATEPVSMFWAMFFGEEIHSEASFPGGHMARIYSAWGFGDQQLVFIVDGKRVYRTPDFEPGNVHEKIVWDPSGKIVTFIASERRIFTYDTETQIGSEE
jgi:hypothetical protein